MYNYSMMDYGNGGFWIIMMFFGLFVTIVIAMLIYRLLRNNNSDTSRITSPLDIASARYAKGELSKQEFDQIKKDISR